MATEVIALYLVFHTNIQEAGICLIFKILQKPQNKIFFLIAFSVHCYFCQLNFLCILSTGWVRIIILQGRLYKRNNLGSLPNFFPFFRILVVPNADYEIKGLSSDEAAPSSEAIETSATSVPRSRVRLSVQQRSKCWDRQVLFLYFPHNATPLLSFYNSLSILRQKCHDSF